ncbi:MAG: DegT/DnrJ/EryC1/StrS family aminotransferase, partial [Bacteroidaceae bacterium]|nr:DegT/DnrJ/EryC1/StrS family aminotransferase [Bacteroidaceae bacterium]
HHKHVHQRYMELLADVKGITVLDNPDEKTDANFWLSTILIDDDLHVEGEENAYAQAVKGAVGGAAGMVHTTGATHTDSEPNANVEAMRMALDKTGIEARPLWKPMHLQPVFRHCPAYVNGVSEEMFHRGLCLPSGPLVTDDDVNYIVEKMLEVLM